MSRQAKERPPPTPPPTVIPCEGSGIHAFLPLASPQPKAWIPPVCTGNDGPRWRSQLTISSPHGLRMQARGAASGSRCFTAPSGSASAQKRRAFPCYAAISPHQASPRPPNKGLGGDGAFYAARTAVSRAAEPAKTTFFAQRASHPAQSLSESEGGERAMRLRQGNLKGLSPLGFPLPRLPSSFTVSLRLQLTLDFPSEY